MVRRKPIPRSDSLSPLTAREDQDQNQREAILLEHLPLQSHFVELTSAHGDDDHEADLSQREPLMMASQQVAEHTQDQKQEMMEDQSSDMPRHDVCAGTKTWSTVATGVSAAGAVACLVSGGVLLARDGRYLGAFEIFGSRTQIELALFAINVALTLCTDGMMYIHSVSLRWTLYQEGRLEFHTNFRLLTSARRFGPNKWYVNLLALCCLVLTYAAASMLFLPAARVAAMPQGSSCLVNGVALVAMGVGLAGQAAIATWCLLTCNSVLTWGSNPLNTTLAAIQHGQMVHHPGRCMLSVHHRHLEQGSKGPQSLEARPRERQGSMCRARAPALLLVIGFTWALAVVALAAPIATVQTIKSMHGGDGLLLSWAGNKRDDSYSFYFSPHLNDPSEHEAASLPTRTQALLALLFMWLVQALQALDLHCLELIVHMARDEAIWQQAFGFFGARLHTNPALAAASSWENQVLFVAKALLHWLIGLSILVWFNEGKTSLGDGVVVDLMAFRLFIYAGGAILLAGFATLLTFRRRAGFLPAAMGHVPTLANLVDVWHSETGKLWWGDKTMAGAEGPRHAGTSGDRALVGPIHGGSLYA